MDGFAYPRMVPRARCPYTTTVVLAAILVISAMPGCATSPVSLRSVPKSPLIDELNLTAYGGPKPSDRTIQLLRVYNLSDDQDNYAALLKKLQAISEREPAADAVYALSELAFLGAKKTERYDKRAALDLYGASVLHAYDYLFNKRFSSTRNQYDPQYRGACDLYNGALESALRTVCATKELTFGTTKINTASGEWDINCVLKSNSWRRDDFKRFEFVSDWQVNGLKNLYQSHGLGVPLIAVRQSYKNESKYYPDGLTFPVTAFLRPVSGIDPQTGQVVARNQCQLELYDPLATNETQVSGWRVPLESDLSTPLAFFLSQPNMKLDSSTLGLLDPKKLLEELEPGKRPLMGLYMLQPYEPGKIPVLMVHGLWSSPITWMEMFNDLRSQPEIRDRYQFWFYLYPTGQPFWQSAAMLRRDLVQVRESLDPSRQEPALDQMVLIGHSMGGLVSHLQTIQSGDDFWKLASHRPLTQIKADPKELAKLQETFYFQPNPSIRRVVMIGTPHRGSTYSNEKTRWLFGKLIEMPQKLLVEKLYSDNAEAFAGDSLLKVDTSIDSLSPSSPVFPVMLASRRPPWVKYHNIVGVVPKDWWLAKLSDEGDTVVSRESAHLDGAASEITVAADHTTVHAHPAAVLEVRRVLLEHIAELEGRPLEAVASRPLPAWPATQPKSR